MPEEHVITSVNKYYLDKVLSLAEQADITATEDIFDARGMKLVAKGARISRGLQERLTMRKLSKPFESSIAVESGVNIDLIAEEAQRIADSVEPVRSIMRTVTGGVSPLQVLSGIQFGSAMSTMLTIIERGGKAALEHSVMVSLLSICLARKFGLSMTDQTVVALAGLLHDIGELYIDPEYLHSNRRLYPHEWRHVVVHPRIGQMLISGLENYPASVAQAVYEHHERFDGSGYPRQVAGSSISAPGQVISVAEMISGIFLDKDKPLQRADLALKILPGEFARELGAAVSVAMQAARDGAPLQPDDTGVPTGEERGRVQALFDRIVSVREMGQGLIAKPELKSKKSQQLLQDVDKRTTNIQHAFSSTGLDVCLDVDSGFFETRSAQILFETAVATSEIQWRLRDVARDLSLQAATLDEGEASALQPLIELLDGE
ncbi:HD-GYP domain-containing protein [Noviherbaspirillum sp. ST9]|uniref:HD-GYP domain-containing protein n=1 Tax=Noviherbaspirillum sp. ST9 TaxID=3401606 RepID=UPI003B587C9B